MSVPTPTLVIAGSASPGSPGASPTQSPGLRPALALAHRSASWPGFADYSIGPKRPAPAGNAFDPWAGAMAEQQDPWEGPSRRTSPKHSLSAAGLAPSTSPSPSRPPLTPLSAIDRVFDVPASQGLSTRLKEIAQQTDTTVLEVLRRLSEAERHSSMSKSASTRAELREFFKTILACTDTDVEACYRLNLPISTWEHVAEQVRMDGPYTQDTLMTALYWRAKHRGERAENFRRTGRTSG